MPTTTALSVVHEGVIFRNPEPGIRALCAYLPNVVPLTDDEVLCFFRLGQAFYSLDGRIGLARSGDGGRSWADETPTLAPILSGAFTYTAPHATRLHDGTLLLLAQRHPSDDAQALRFNNMTGGMRPVEFVLTRSSDDGRTWSPPQSIDPGTSIAADSPSSVLELPDGTLFLAFETWKNWEDASPLHIRGFALFSHDGGATWGDRLAFPSAADTDRMYSHTRYTRLADGTLGALQWTQSVGGEQNFDLHLVTSDASGRVWSQPRPTGIPAQTSWLADLGGGRLAVAYTERTGMQPGIKVALSDDGGTSWDLDNSLLAWDAVGQEWLGVERRPAYPASHDNIAFGKPNLVVLPSGDLLVSWWCTQACVTHARCARLSVG
jgi:hypothetical protein